MFGCLVDPPDQFREGAKIKLRIVRCIDRLLDGTGYVLASGTRTGVYFTSIEPASIPVLDNGWQI
ncbi:MAG TPA: hypothetical protein VMF66_01965 [Candidatus Acidoferrum sp.]|nr:hypothetical protein [Candidatus Acidoferrum sp.]